MFNIELFEELLKWINLNINPANMDSLDNTGKILNWSGEHFDEQVLKTTPEMIGRGGKALQESHIFLNPIWDEFTNPIDWNVVNRYNLVIEKFNEFMGETYPNWKQMKNPLLALNFVNLGYLTVMQSSLYLLSDNKKEIIECTHMLAKLFETAGFIVIREKIEASVYGIDGIPKTNKDALEYSGYFEFHIRVESNLQDKSPLDKLELDVLDQISREFSEKFNIPVPLSFNRSAHIDGGYQRYLNVRFRNIGSTEAIAKVKEITSKINNSTNLKVVKVISEYVWYDTYVELDKGWIDF